MTLRAYRGGTAFMATLIPGIGTSADKLHAELRTLIASSRQQVAESFPDAEIVSTLSTQLSLSHMVAIVALKTPQAGQFYARRGTRPRWPHLLRRVQPRKSVAAAIAQRRHHRVRVLD